MKLKLLLLILSTNICFASKDIFFNFSPETTPNHILYSTSNSNENNEEGTIWHKTIIEPEKKGLLNYINSLELKKHSSMFNIAKEKIYQEKMKYYYHNGDELNPTESGYIAFKYLEE